MQLKSRCGRGNEGSEAGIAIKKSMVINPILPLHLVSRIGTSPHLFIVRERYRERVQHIVAQYEQLMLNVRSQILIVWRWVASLTYNQ